MSALMDLLGAAGTVLDTPAAMLRASLLGQNPLEGVFDPAQRVSGLDLFRARGVEANPLLAGATEAILDPVNLVMAVPAVRAWHRALGAGARKAVALQKAKAAGYGDEVKFANELFRDVDNSIASYGHTRITPTEFEPLYRATVDTEPINLVNARLRDLYPAARRGSVYDVVAGPAQGPPLPLPPVTRSAGYKEYNAFPPAVSPADVPSQVADFWAGLSARLPDAAGEVQRLHLFDAAKPKGFAVTNPKYPGVLGLSQHAGLDTAVHEFRHLADRAAGLRPTGRRDFDLTSELAAYYAGNQAQIGEPLLAAAKEALKQRRRNALLSALTAHNALARPDWSNY